MNIPMIYCEAYRGSEPYIFISYAHKDSEIVYPILNNLNEMGYHIWYDEGIDPGNEWSQAIANAIFDSCYFIVFISNHSVNSKNVTDEINFSLNNKKTFLAIHLEETDLPRGLDLRMSSIQAIMKYRMDDNSFYRKLTKTLEGKSLRDITEKEQKPISLPKEDKTVTSASSSSYELQQDVSGAAATEFTPPEKNNFQPYENSKKNITQNDTDKNIDKLLDVSLEIIVVLGSALIAINEIKTFCPGILLQTNTKAGEPIDVFVNGGLIARGEIVVIENNFGIRLIQIIKNGQAHSNGKDAIDKIANYYTEKTNTSKVNCKISNSTNEIHNFKDIPLQVIVELGRTAKSIAEILEFAIGTIIELNTLSDEPLHILVNEACKVAGEVIVIDEYLGIRITEVMQP